MVEPSAELGDLAHRVIGAAIEEHRPLDGYLARNGMSCSAQFHAQRFLVDGLQEARTEKAVHFDRGTDDTVGQVVELRAWLHPPTILGDLGVLAVHSLQSSNSLAQLPANSFHYSRTAPNLPVFLLLS